MLQPDIKSFESQRQLAEYCRTGVYGVDIVGVRTDNVSWYRNLVYGVVKDALDNVYPLTRNLLGDKQWDKITRYFFSNHKCQSPQIWHMPKEFYTFLIETSHPVLKKYPQLKSLLWFEWIEVALFMMDDKPRINTGFADLTENKLVVNPEHEIFMLTYPAHKMDAKTMQKKDEGIYYICGHRNTEGQVIFTELTAALVRILEYLDENPTSFKSLIEKLEAEFQFKINSSDKASVFCFLQDAQKTELILSPVNQI